MAPEATPTFHCPCCGSADSRIVGRATDRQFGTTQKQFDLRECLNCRVIVLFPPPTESELASSYPPGYWWQTAAPSAGSALWHKLLEGFRHFLVRGQVRTIKGLTIAARDRPRRLLDIGCGDGSFLAACQGLPFVRVGLDKSVDALRAAKERGSMGVLKGSIEALPFADGSFTVVTLFHVLEHLSSPLPCLREIHRLLEPGGWFVVQVPNTRSLERSWFGQNWAGFDAPRHLVNYSDRSLAALLEREGFIINRINHFSWRDNPAGLVRSIFPHAFPPGRRLTRLQSPPSLLFDSLSDLWYLLLVLIATPVAWAESLVGHGGTVFVEALKPPRPMPSGDAAAGARK